MISHLEISRERGHCVLSIARCAGGFTNSTRKPSEKVLISIPPAHQKLTFQELGFDQRKFSSEIVGLFSIAEG